MFRYNVPLYYYLYFAVPVMLLGALYHLFSIRRPKRGRYGELSEKEQFVINMSTD